MQAPVVTAKRENRRSRAWSSRDERRARDDGKVHVYGKRKNGKHEFVPRDQFPLTCALLLITSTPKLVASR